jgi:hypothetical protein
VVENFVKRFRYCVAFLKISNQFRILQFNRIGWAFLYIKKTSVDRFSIEILTGLETEADGNVENCKFFLPAIVSVRGKLVSEVSWDCCSSSSPLNGKILTAYELSAERADF